MASPLYFWTVTARLKCFIERLYAISIHDRYPVKKTALLMTAGDDDGHTFQHAVSYYRIFSGVLGNQNIGEYCAGGCTGCESLTRRIAPEHLENAYHWGLNTKI